MEAVNLQKDLTPKKIVIPEVILEAPSPSKVKTNVEFAPAEIQEIRNRKNLAYAQARKLHETIRVMDDPAHRLEAMLQLLANMDFVQECWTIMDQWAKSGEITALQEKKAAATIENLTLQQLLQQQGNLPSYICKAKKSYKLATDPRKKAKFLAGLQEKTIRLEQITNRINTLINEAKQ